MPAGNNYRALVRWLSEVRARTDHLFGLVDTKALYDRPIPERHRIIFYLGHLEAFDWNLFQPRLAGLEVFDPSLDQLFAFGIDPVDGGLPSDQPADWPAEKAVRRYVARVRDGLDSALDCHSSSWAGDQPPELLLNVAAEHRLMHAETLSYMLHQLPLDRKLAEYQAATPDLPPPVNEPVEISGSVVELGLSRQEGEPFGWDNEFETHRVDVPAFTIDRCKVTNSQYLRFVEAGGYDDPGLWNADDWAWKTEHGIRHPVFWKRGAGGWLYRGMFEEVPLPLDSPVYVSHAEASAYTRWAGKRLPAEAEWHRAAYGAPAGGPRPFPWGSEPPAALRGYYDFERWDPLPVGAFPSGRSAFGVEGMLGNGWEWTSTPFRPFPGFRPFPFYPGYSANFFDEKHFVLKGGSTRTDRSLLRPSFRNWFQPHYQYIYAGFRCAEC